MKTLLMTIAFLLAPLFAESNGSCMEKLKKLEELKAEKVSLAERLGVGLLAGVIYVKDPRGKELDQQIRVLELELKACQQNGY